MKRILLAISLFALATPASATGLMACKSGDRANWKTTDQLKRKMITDGWQVRRIKEDGGCYEAYGTTPKGRRVEAYFHPVTLELLLVARRGEILFRRKN
jgi:hypothetical protein